MSMRLDSTSILINDELNDEIKELKNETEKLEQFAKLFKPVINYSAGNASIKTVYYETNSDGNIQQKTEERWVAADNFSVKKESNIKGFKISSTIYGFTYTGKVQTFTVPDGVTSIFVDAYGASGDGSKGGRGEEFKLI